MDQTHVISFTRQESLPLEPSHLLLFRKQLTNNKTDRRGNLLIVTEQLMTGRKISLSSDLFESTVKILLKCYSLFMLRLMKRIFYPNFIAVISIHRQPQGRCGKL